MEDSRDYLLGASLPRNKIGSCMPCTETAGGPRRLGDIKTYWRVGLPIVSSPHMISQSSLLLPASSLRPRFHIHTLDKQQSKPLHLSRNFASPHQDILSFNRRRNANQGSSSKVP
ncbi:hypothetical protein V2G26_015640 [Clonostachys chloroleuca]